MKKSTLIIALFLIFSCASLVQSQDTPFGNNSTITGGLGMAFIDGEQYIAFQLHPDIGIGKFGVGLNINLLYNTESGAIRSQDWDEDYDWARLIRYIRYGHKRDKVYARIGTLDAARLGHGFIMNYYTNEASYDQRKIGLAFDLDFGLWGFESVTSNMGRMEIIGGRAYVRPLQPFLTIPIIKNIAVGGTYVTDVDPDGRRSTEDNVYTLGFDIEVPLINVPMFNSYAYFDWAKIDTFGNGRAIGAEAHLRIIAGVAEITARVERRWLGEHFVPSFYDAFYEIQRYMPSDVGMIRKYDQLPYITDETRGIFGELVGHVLNTLRLVGNYQKLDDDSNVSYKTESGEEIGTGVFHLAADIPDAVPTIAAHATYDRFGIKNGGDLFKLDERSIARAGIGYKIKPYLLVNMDYVYTFKPAENGKGFETQKRFVPSIQFVYNF